MSIMDYWVSEYTPRESQVIALKWLEDNQDKDFFVMDLPVGIGKSFIGTTFANYLHKTRNDETKTSFIITPQKILQRQYENTFIRNPKFSAFSFYGKSNYHCHSHGDSTCDIGSLLKNPICGKGCEHAMARMQARGSEHLILNYALALTSFAYSKVFRKRKLMVLDECHNLENNLIDFAAIPFYRKKCEKDGISWPDKNKMDFSIMFEWLKNDYVPKNEDILATLVNAVEMILNNDHPTKTDVAKIKQMEALSKHMKEIDSLITSDVMEIAKTHVIVMDDQSIKIKQLYGAQNFNDMLYPYADKFLFMSSTIFDHKLFCRNLGIPADQVAYLALPSEFPKENRPVYYNPVMKMNYQWNDDKNESSRRQYIKEVIKILNDHPEDSGIIHTGNYKIAEWLVENIKYNDTHNVLHHNQGSNINRDLIIKAFQQSEHPSVLISPSITEGLDLCDDLARFAVFAKVPFGNLMDQWIKKRQALSQKWYFLESLKDIIQGCGRVVRNNEDHGVVYILDESWGYLYTNVKTSIPKWWLDAYEKL